jgi:hypothetical protein
MNYPKGSFRSPKGVENVEIQNESALPRQDALAALI